MTVGAQAMSWSLVRQDYAARVTICTKRAIYSQEPDQPPPLWTQGQVQVVADHRPWLGAYVAATNSLSTSSPLSVVGIVPGSPAAEVLQWGDVIRGVAGLGIPSTAGTLGSSLIDQLEDQKAGANVSLEILTAQGAPSTVTVKLGSVSDASADVSVLPEDESVILF